MPEPDDPLALLRASREEYLEVGDTRALDAGIAAFAALEREALSSSIRGDAVNLVAELFLYRYEAQGAGDDLEAAIACWSSLVDSFPSGTELWRAGESNLASALAARFDALGRDEDLDRAVEGFRRAIALSTPGTQMRGVLESNLGAALLSVADRDGGRQPLEEAIAVLRAALDAPISAEERPGTEANLGLALHAQWSAGGARADLDAGIAALDGATSDEPDRSPSWPLFAMNLAMALLDRHGLTGALSDLERAIELNEAVLLRTASSPLHAGAANNLASSLFSRYDVAGDVADLERAFELAVLATEP